MKELKNLVPSFYKIRIFFIGIALVSSVAFLTYRMINAVGDGRFFLLHEDEVIYYCSAKLFAATNSLRAESCIDENVSRIGQVNWYGPGYNIGYGLVFKIFGVRPALFPWIHYFLALASLAIIFLCPISLESKLLCALSLSIAPQFGMYVFTYFPETLNLFLATVLSCLLVLVYVNEDEQKKQRLVIVFVVAVFILMLFRITFIFWLAALIGLSKTKREYIISTCIFAGGLVISLVYMKLFIAPPYAGQMHKINHLYDFDLIAFYKATRRSISDNFGFFVDPQTPLVTLMFFLFLLAVITAVISRNKLVLGALLTAVCLVLTMMAYYAVDEFYFVKQTVILVPLFLLALAAGPSKKVFAYLSIILVAFFFEHRYKMENEAIHTGRSAFDHYQAHAKFENSLSEIRDHVGEGPVIILWDYRQYDFYGYSAQALLPFDTHSKKPIMYTTNIVDAAATHESRFQLHNRLKVDFILSRTALELPGLKEVHATEFYRLYKLNNE
jgi:hypothetical protein